MKYASIDIETTGLCPWQNQTIEVGVVIDDLSLDPSPPIGDLPTFHCYVWHEALVGNPYVLSRNPEVLRTIADGEHEGIMQPEEVGPELAEFFKDNGVEGHPTVAGKAGGGLVVPFLEYLPGFTDYVNFHRRSLDPATYFLNRDDECVPSLNECMERAGIEGEVLHTVVEDAMDIVKLVRYGCRRWDSLPN
jgi:hypothetical protein